MYLDPQAQALADQLAHLPRPDFSTLSVADYRAMLAAFPMPADGEDGLASITDHSLPGPGGAQHGDVEAFGGGKIDVVDAGSVPTDDLQAGSRFERTRRDRLDAGKIPDAVWQQPDKFLFRRLGSGG